MQGFADRLDFVMGVTRTTNSSLARALSFDASYICRIRNGKRRLPHSQPFAEPAAAYLVSRMSDARQVRALEEEIGCAWPADGREAAELLAEWLLTGSLLADAGGTSAVSQVIAALNTSVPDSLDPAASDSNPMPDDAWGPLSAESILQSPHVSFHYGNEGKREAVLSFLGHLVAEGRPRELLLHSDEDMSWLYEDDAFARKWTALLLRVIDNGCRVRIVHAISRDANEMWEAVGKWIPLYMTGAIEPGTDALVVIRVDSRENQDIPPFGRYGKSSRLKDRSHLIIQVSEVLYLRKSPATVPQESRRLPARRFSVDGPI